MTTSHTSTGLDATERPFGNIINFRDVGKTINGFMGKPVLKEGVLFRSGRLDDASEHDKRRLFDEYHISTVLDLRSKSEHKLAAQTRRAEHGLDTNDHLVDIPGINHVLMSITGKTWEWSVVRRLDWVNFLKVLGLAASGYRHAATKIVSELMAPRGLIGLGQDTIDFSTGEMRKLFHFLADSRPGDNPNNEPNKNEPNKNGNGNGNGCYPLLLSCTKGKDRTGLIVLLLLLLTQSVPDAAIAREYMRSELDVGAKESSKELRAFGVPEVYLKCPEEFPETICEYLKERYGGIEGYLEFAGVGKEERRKIRSKLLV